MAAVRGLRISVKAEATAEPRGAEPEPMEVEEGELETIPVRRSLRELIPVRGGLPGGGGAGACGGSWRLRGAKRGGAEWGAHEGKRGVRVAASGATRGLRGL